MQSCSSLGQKRQDTLALLPLGEVSLDDAGSATTTRGGGFSAETGHPDGQCRGSDVGPGCEGDIPGSYIKLELELSSKELESSSEEFVLI